MENKPQPTPAEDLNSTVKRLLDANSALQEKIEELEGDKRHFQRKLEEYIQHDFEEEKHQLESQQVKLTDKLKSEVASLQAQLMSKEREIRNLYLHHPDVSSRDQKASVLQRLNEMELASRGKDEQIERLLAENFKLRGEMESLRRNCQYHQQQHHRHHHHLSSSSSGNRQAGGGLERLSSWEKMSCTHSSSPSSSSSEVTSSSAGPSSLPESLPSYSSSKELEDIPNISGLKLSSGAATTPAGQQPFSPVARDSDISLLAELKKVKKQLEKYKSANIELDQKLKDTKLELQKFTEGRHSTENMYRMDMERLRSANFQLMAENRQLRAVSSRPRY